MKLDDFIPFIPFHHRHLLSVWRLLRSDSRNPNIISFQSSFQRLHLFYVIMFFSQLYRFVKSINSMLSHIFFYSMIISIIGWNEHIVFFIGIYPSIIGFVEHSPCIYRENIYWKIILKNIICDYLVFHPKTRRKNYFFREIFNQQSQSLFYG